jgi:F-type H+-transporting ATPase subunit delta
MQTVLAARYARALADVVREPASLEKTAAELELFAALIRDSKTLRDFISNPAFPRARKIQVLDALLQKSRTSAPTGRLIQLLLQKGRIDLLPEVGKEFRKMEAQASGRVSVEVTTAIPLDAALRKRMVTCLEKFTGRQIRLEARVDPEILAGARARIGSVVYDGSVAGRLQKMKRQLIGER